MSNDAAAFLAAVAPNLCELGLLFSNGNVAARLWDPVKDAPNLTSLFVLWRSGSVMVHPFGKVLQIVYILRPHQPERHKKNSSFCWRTFRQE